MVRKMKLNHFFSLVHTHPNAFALLLFCLYTLVLLCSNILFFFRLLRISVRNVAHPSNDTRRKSNTKGSKKEKEK